MKLRARIEGSKVHRVGYRLFLANRAIDIDLPGFSAQNRIENGRQVVLAFFEGDESQIVEFRRFIEAEKPPEAEVSSITIQDYQGQVGDTLLFHQKMSSQHLGKGIDAILRMEKKQDMMLDKQDTTIGILKEVKEDTANISNLQVQMLDKQDTTIGVLKEVKEDTASIRNDISELKKDTMDTILEKYFELSREIAEIKATLSEIKAKVS
jgi:acylphosphatase